MTRYACTKCGHEQTKSGKCTECDAQVEESLDQDMDFDSEDLDEGADDLDDE